MMDRESPVTEDELHAFVDGELPADRQAAVEAWLAAHLVQWLSKRLGYDLRAPDLAAIGLKLVGGRLLPGPSGAAGFLMYEGPSGERFTLYSARWDAPETALRYRDAGQIAAFYWVDSNKAYVMSGPADRDRLRKIAQSAYDQLETRATGKGRS